MLRELPKKSILFLLLLLLIFSGCISQEEKIQLKQKCIDLSSDFFPAIPECFSQDECFSLSNKSFFSSLYLPENIQAKVFLLNNSIARSWLYFNLARKEVKEINKQCMQEDFVGIDSKLNNARHFLFFAFNEADNALKTELEILMAEKNFLESIDVNLLNDTPLFDSFSELNDNLNIFISPDAFNDSFIKQYYSSIDSFNKLSKEKGFNESILKEKTPLDLIAGFDLLLFKKFEKDSSNSINFFVPFIGKAFHSIISDVFIGYELKQTMNFFNNFPIFEFFSIYSKMLSTEHSVTQKFAFLLTKNSIALNEIEKNNALLLNELDQNLAIAFNEFNELKSINLSFPVESISSFSSALINESDLATELSNASIQLNELKNSSLTIGRKHYLIYLLSNKISLIQEKITQLKQKPLFLKESCINSALTMKKELSTFNTANFSFEEEFIFNSIENHLNAFNSNSSLSESLFHCSEFISSFNKLKAMIADKNISLQELKEKEAVLLASELSFEFNELLASARKKARIIIQIASFFPASLSASEKELIEKKLEFFNSFNDENNLSKTLSELHSFNSMLELQLKKSISFYLLNSFKVIESSEAIIGDNFNAEQLIEFFNPFEDLNIEFSFALPLNFNAESIDFFSQNISFATINSNELFLTFSFLPYGESFVKIKGRKFISFKESNELIKLSESIALFKKKIFIENKEFLNKAFLSIALEGKALNAVLNDKTIPFTQKAEQVSFNLINLKENSVLEVLYAVENPFKSELNCFNENSFDFKQEKSCNLTFYSSLNIKIKQLEVSLPLSKQNILNASIKLNEKELSFSWLSSNLILLSFPEELSFPFSLTINFTLIDDSAIQKELSFLESELNSIDASLLEEKDKDLLSSLKSNLNDLKTNYVGFAMNKFNDLLKQIYDIKVKIQFLTNKTLESKALIERIYLLHAEIDKKLLALDKSIVFAKTLNDSKLLNDLINAKQLIISFKEKSNYFLKNDLMQSLSYAEKALNVSLPLIPSIEKIKENMLLKVKELKSIASMLELTEIKELNLIEKSLLLNDLSIEDLNNFNFQLKLIELSFLDKSKNIALSLKQDIEFINSFTSEDSILFKDIDFLLEQIKNIPSAKLIESKYLLSFNEKQLNELKDSIKSIVTQKDLRTYSEFFDLIEKQEFIKALQLIDQKEIKAKKSFILNAKEKISFWKNKLESDAKTMLSLNEESKEFIEAKKLIEDKKFLQAIVLLSLSKKENINLLYLLPFALILVILIFFRLPKKEKIEPIKVKLPKIS